MPGVVKVVVPEPSLRTLPPVEAANQSMVAPALAVAEIFTVPVPHLIPTVATVGLLFTIAVTAVLTDTQPVVVFLASA